MKIAEQHKDRIEPSWLGLPAKVMAPEVEALPKVGTAKAVAKPAVLLELRPALDGFAGIPQETRLLFRGLRMIEGVQVEGMIQASHRILSKGTGKPGFFSFGRFASESTKINRYSRVVISLADKPFKTIIDKVQDIFERRLQSTSLTIGTLLGYRKVRLSQFRSQYFEDFIWRTLFAKTLPASDFSLITAAHQRICSTPWHTMHMVGLKTLNVFPSPRYPHLDTEGADIFIAQTPYPGRVNRDTAMVVRYHDALPVFMPHTIPDKSAHQATHFYALKSNVRSGAWFACVSEATRKDLLRLFPEAAERAVTIHNMVSHHYFPEPSSPARVGGIVRSRLYEGDPVKGVSLLPDFLSIKEKENFYRKHLGQDSFKYLLMVSTIEPRKNHARLLAAWEVIKADIDPDMKLVVVGTLGWDCESMTRAFRPWIDRGELFVLNAVPAPDLRVLYKHATATVCPSLGEGFDFSGVESMRSGGVVLASDIPVHREVYADAAEFFDPYATGSLVAALKKVVYADDAAEVQASLRERGQEVSSQYLPEKILPQWQAFLDHVLKQKRR
jgi:glycosyltransferase involved in cell wall biosynthesis